MNVLSWPSLFGRSSREMRWMALRWYLEPFARILFDRVPEVRSVVFAVAQYYNDESTDAVHHVIVPTDRRAPEWPQCLCFAGNSLIPVDLPTYYEDLDEEGREIERLEAEARANDPSNFSRYNFERVESPLGRALRYAEQVLGVSGGLDDNYSMRDAFAEFCKPNANQGMDVADAYTPYAIVRRGEDNAAEPALTVEIVGRPLNPPSPFDLEHERYRPELRADGPFELVPPTDDELATTLARLDLAQSTIHRASAYRSLLLAARALDAADRGADEDDRPAIRPRDDAKLRALLRAIAVARGAMLE